MALRLFGLPHTAEIVAAALLIALPGALSHPCEADIASACPDSPASDVAACLKDPSVHEQATSISSDCTDFMALNLACGEDIEKFCDDALFSDDTTPCLTQWTQPEDLSAKCKGVLAWAVPAEEVADEDDGPTDELGMSEKDKEEKREWQAKRRAARGDAIERLKMKDADRKKEEDRVALEQFKAEDPEGYADMMRQQEEEKRQVAEQKRRERQMQAALERKKEEAEKARRREAGEEVDEDVQKKAPKAKKPKSEKKGEGTSTMTALLCFVLIAAACVGGVFVVKKVTTDADDSHARKGKALKKKRA